MIEKLSASFYRERYSPLITYFFCIISYCFDSRIEIIYNEMKIWNSETFLCEEVLYIYASEIANSEKNKFSWYRLRY